MRMMGRDSVAYHQATILDRADDHPGQVLDYYGTRGETPLVWGGSGAARLGLTGTVSTLTYGLVFGEGGAADPVIGDRLVSTQRPGMELVVSPHKSVAVLGAVGRAEDMHAIVDAETGATLEFLDGWFRERGGRRGRDQVRTETSGLTWAVTRHGTSRAGDPAVHDHVLIANIVEMGDTRGGWKALDTASLRDVLHAATIIGRAAAARQAVELGYGIEADDGRSGRLRGWRIAGVPDEVCELFSKRSAEIDDFVDDRGQDSYRARAVAARTTRAVKVDHAPDLLAVRWHEELDGIGWAPSEVLEAIATHRDLIPELIPELVPGVRPELVPVRDWDRAPDHAPDRAPVLDDGGLAALVDVVLGPGSRLAGVKVLSRRDLVVEVGPHLYGHPVTMIDTVVDRILRSQAVVPLVAVTAAREQVYATTHSLAVEQAIADTVEHLATQPAQPVQADDARRAVTAKEAALGGRLTAGQAEAVYAIGAAPARVQFIVGVAGAGKTTALDAATTALESAGWHVIGTSTSGQAARTLGTEAGIEARTVASLLWRLDHGRLPLTQRSVVVLDEAAMTTDDDLLRLVTAIDATGARLVLVGDPAQLGAVGPGGAMAALMARHPHLVTRLEENVRQHDPGERTAITNLRTGHVTDAVAWYSANDRIRHAPALPDTLHHMVTAWDDDVIAGRSTTMLAWRRDHVAELNTLARAAAITAGWVHGPSLTVDNGFEVAAGDELVALAANHAAGIITSQRLRVAAVDPDRHTVTVTTADDRAVELPASELGAGRVGYGYATTIHRAQGATFDTCHVYADGGTHQLTYVALTRARQTTTIHTVADTPAQAVEDLASAWRRPDSQRWIIDDGPDRAHLDRTPRRISDDLRHAHLQTERQTLLELRGSLTDTTEHSRLTTRRQQVERDRARLRAGTGTWEHTPAGVAARRLTANSDALEQAVERAESPGLSWRDRRAARHQVDQLRDAVTRASDSWARHGRPVDEELSHRIDTLSQEIRTFPNDLDRYDTSQLLDHRIDHIEQELGIAPQPVLRRRLDTPDLDYSLDLGL